MAAKYYNNSVLENNELDSLFEFVVVKGNGVKGLHDSGISTVPEKFVQPAQDRISRQKIVAIRQAQQPIDLSGFDGPGHDRIAKAIIHAAETYGFFQVVNHGVPLRVLESIKESAHTFFQQEPVRKAVFLKEVSPSPLVKYGTSFLPEKETVWEWKDYLSMSYTNDEEALQQWPNNCKEAVLEYLKTSTNLVRKLANVLLEPLLASKSDELPQIINGLIGRKTVKMNFYPACPNPEHTVGIARHSDMGTITVLLQDGIGGLYVRVERDNNNININNHEHEQEWMEIPPVDGALVINIGDSLQILSNGRYKSAEHTVKNSKECRVSIPLFTAPLPNHHIGPLPALVELDGVANYKEVLVSDYMSNYFENTHGAKNHIDFARP